MINSTFKLSCIALLMPGILYAQSLKKITLTEAVELGLANSKNLKLAQNKIEESRLRLDIVKDQTLPTADVSFLYNHAEIPTHKLVIGGASPLTLPNRADMFLGTAAVQQLVYGGGKLKYARESTRLLAEVAGLDADKNKEEVTYAVINSYYTLYKLLQSKKVVAQNLASIATQLKQAERFFEQGIVTKNDVLRFQLQQSNITLTDLEIESNRKVINYNLNILLGLQEDTELEITDPVLNKQDLANLTTYLDRALNGRQELQQLDLRNRAAESNLKAVKANTLPTFGLGANLYFVNPSGKFIPSVNQYIMPITMGATLSWNIGNLWTNKHKISQSRIQQKSIQIQKEIESDQVKTEVNQNYQQYQLALNKINILETAIAQALENDRLQESKYKNNVSSAIDRIDAETILYQAKINLEIARADAGLAYYTLLKSTGKISQ